MSESNPADKKEIAVENKAPQPAASFHPLMSLHNEIDRVFDRFFKGGPFMDRRRGPGLPGWGGFAGLPTRALSQELTLRSDFSESDDRYELTVEMPGLTDKDVELSVSDNTVTVKGEKKQETEKKDDDYHVMERSYGSFRRSFTLPQGVKADDIAATVKNGVLTVTMPKTAEAKSKARKIKVKGS